MALYEGNAIGKGVHIAVQVMFTAVFLTLFYFSYVVGVEQEEFVNQIEYLVDDISKEATPVIDSEIKNTPGGRYEIIGVLDGAIDGAEQSAVDSTAKSNAWITKNNKAVTKTSMNLLIITCATVVLGVLLFTLLGHDTQISSSIKHGLLAVCFVAATEYGFLTIVGSKYTSADPYVVKRELGAKLVSWIAQARASGKIPASG